MSKKNPTKNLSKFVRFTGLGLQMGLTIYFASLIGDWLDTKYPSENMSWHKTLTIFAVFGSTYSIIRQVIKLGNSDNAK